MAKILMYASRALVITLCFVVLGAANIASVQSKPAGQNNPPKKKKLPPGAKGFEQFADRDASDKLVTGGATRGNCETYEELIECAGGQFEQKNFKEAIEFFMQASAKKPNMFRPHYNLGQIYEEQGKYKEAADQYKLAIKGEVNPGMGEVPDQITFVYYNLGNVYALMNDHAQAISTFQEVIRRMPIAAQPHYNVGLSLAAQGKHQEAINAFKEALKLKPDYWEAQYNMGVAYSKLEEYPQAIEAFKKTLENNADYAPAHYNLGVVYYLTDNTSGLAEVVKTLQKAKPEMAKDLAKLSGQ